MLAKMCRICGRSNICDKSKNLFEENNKKLLRHIQMLTGLRLRNATNAPLAICFCCQSDLKVAMSFRRLCVKNQKKWQPFSEDSGTFSSSEQESLSSCESLSVKEQPQKTLQVMIKVSQAPEYLENAQEHDHLELDYVIKDKTDVDRDDKNKESVANSIVSKSILLQSTRACKKLLKTKPEVTTVYICELCGAHVNGKASFDRHIRKHTGERPFGCDECYSRFLSAAELRSHCLTHTGERPFPCRYCDRRYVSYMGRLKHERIHTNERPFVCAECGKTFTNTYILKNHMLVHTGERLFRCDPCQRSFQRKTHLRTHYRSNTHQQNVEKHSEAQVVPAESI